FASRICCLSGPSHAEEGARHLPTAVVIAGSSEGLLIELQRLFSNDYFRVYRSLDMIGVEIGGAVKNIIAIAAGMIDGLGFGDNTIGALITRGIAEISRLGITLGARQETFLGLSGIGDLITTATSKHSRNRFVGYELGKGNSLASILSTMKMVAEGVATTRSVQDLSQKLQVEMPITEQIYRVLYEGIDPKAALLQLMTRDLKSE
ncbi:MAG: NAD(P)H-dependent glycerol-3-phosphate dehydrogenase, partial [Candidatus Cloacimonadaceae bacterium]|nr:NAD(P)H-dependent glycerol-3-phosphate dehydrogenase [Candidatus Cloacimonadaceae bacterium]